VHNLVVHMQKPPTIKACVRCDTHVEYDGKSLANTEGLRHTYRGAGYGSLHWSTARLLVESRGGLRQRSLTSMPTLSWQQQRQ
jgi:hypothetical protein